MLPVLARILGPHRAVSVYAFLKQWGLGVVFVLGLVAILAGLFLRGDGQRDHIAYVEAEVLEVTPLNGSEDFGVLVDLRLPDGHTLQLTETEGLITRALDGTACVEKLKGAGGHPFRYRLRREIRCRA